MYSILKFIIICVPDRSLCLQKFNRLASSNLPRNLQAFYSHMTSSDWHVNVRLL